MGWARTRRVPLHRLLSAGAAIAMAQFLLGCSGSPPGATRPAAAGTLTLQLDQYFRELRTLRLDSEVGSLTLLFDTGGGATSVTPDVAARMGCEPYGRDVAHRMTGELVEFRQCDAREFRVGDWRGRVEPLAVFDVNALLPRELPRLDGVLALDAFRGHVFTLDWPAGQLQVHPDDEAGRIAASRGLTLRLATGDTGRTLEVFLPVDSTRGRLWFLLDSGNIRGTLVSRYVVEHGLLPVAQGARGSLVIGGRAPVDLPVVVDDLVIDGALGTGYLMTGPVTLDLRIATSKP